MPRPARIIAWIALLEAAFCLLIALLTPRSWHLDIGAPGDAYYLRGAFPSEGEAPSLRWLGAESSLTLHGASAGHTVFTARLYREPNTAEPWLLTLSDADSPPKQFAAGVGWRTYQLLLPADAERALILTGPTFQPGTADPRELSVALDSVGLEPVRTAPPLVAGLVRWSFLVCLAAVFGAGVGIAVVWTQGGHLARLRRMRDGALAAMALGLAVLAAWAWLHPPSLAWMLPSRWGAFALVAAALGVLALLIPLELGRRVQKQAPALQAGLAPLTVAGWVVAHLVLFAPVPPEWSGLAALLILAAPGALTALVLFAHEPDPLERTLLAAAGAVAVAAMLVLGLHAIPGPLAWWLLLLAADGIAIASFRILKLVSTQNSVSLPFTPAIPATNRLLALILLFAAALRLPNLGYSEFQGDEAYVLLLARGILHGQPDSLMVHMKGPVEALLPAGLLVLTGTITEWIARLPFTLAGLGVLIGVALLARRLIGGEGGAAVGVVAVALLSLDGFLIAFSRIVQYQSIVMLMAVAAIWLAWRFAEDAAAGLRYLYAAAFCAAVGALAHYDGAFIAPALAWMVFLGARRRGWTVGQMLRALLGPTLLGLALCLSFYLPFVLHENFAQTIDHLGTRSGQRSVLPSIYNNLPGYIELAGFYSTVYWLGALGALLFGGLAVLIVRFVRPRPLALGLAGFLISGVCIALFLPGWVDRTPEWSFAAFLIAPPLLALACAPALPAGLRTLVLWYVAPFSAMAFLLADPRTHFYTTHPAGALIAAWAVVALWEAFRSRSRVFRWSLAAAGVALLALVVPFTRQAFLTTQPEYERAYPYSMLALYTPPSGPVAPDDGLFGFARADGWKAVAELYRNGTLTGSFDTNVEVFVPGWYLHGRFRCAREPEQFVTALAEPPLYIPPGYHHHTTVTVGGVPSLAIFSRDPTPGLRTTIDAASAAAAFDAAPVPDFPLRRLLSGPVPQHTLEDSWRAGFTLRGFDLDTTRLRPNDSAFLTLYWRAAAPLDLLVQPEVLILDAAGNEVARAPTYCGGIPSTDWANDKVNDTPFRIDAANLPPGSYALAVAARDIAADTRLPLLSGETSLVIALFSVVAP